MDDGKIGDPAYVAPLTDLSRDSDAMVRSTALRSLLDIRQEEKGRVIQESEAEEAPLTAEVGPAAQKDEALPRPEIDVSLWLEGGRLERETRELGVKAKWLF